MITVVALSVGMGLVLGLLGGGGSILTLPILLYGAGIEVKEAIATSLVVVGATSLVGAIQHARMGHVHWRTGLLFGGAGMTGAYIGGLLAGYVSGTVLLLSFAAVMVVAGLAMLRPRPTPADGAVPRPFRPAPVLIEGLVVGLVTGLVGAGGGFLVVPALVIFAGMSMHAAIGTSLLIIALKSFAGVAGHLSHVAIDPQLTAAVTAAAIVGGLVGTAASSRVQPEKLRTAFALLVFVMAAYMVRKEAPADIVDAVFVQRWPWWAGGLGVAATVLAMLLVGNRTLGVSTGFMDACMAPFSPEARRSWRLPLIVGIVLGGGAAALLGGGPAGAAGWQFSGAMGAFDSLVSSSMLVKAAVFGGGGVLVGFGARLAGGCTSGHGIVGMAQLAPSSIIATMAFMVGGFATTHLALAMIGG